MSTHLGATPPSRKPGRRRSLRHIELQASTDTQKALEVPSFSRAPRTDIKYDSENDEFLLPSREAVSSIWLLYTCSCSLLVQAETELATRLAFSKSRLAYDLKDETVRLRLWGTRQNVKSLKRLLKMTEELGQTVTLLLVEVASIIVDHLCPLIFPNADHVIDEQMRILRYVLEHYRTRLALDSADSSNDRGLSRSSDESTLSPDDEMYSYSSIQELDLARLDTTLMDLKSYTTSLMDLLPTMDHIAATVVPPAQSQQPVNTPITLGQATIKKEPVESSKARESASLHMSHDTGMNNLALALSDQGKYAEAEKMHRETLALMEKVSGKEHPHTLTNMNNLALALSVQGKYAEAEKMHRETLALREKASGKEHPHTLTSMNNLAQALSKQGKYAEAEKMHRETLALREVSGKEHPHTLTSMNDLAQALSDQGKYAEAEKMHRETLALREKVSGKEHPHTLTSMNNLAATLSDQRKYAEAEKMHQETLALIKKVLGKEHPHTLTSMNNLALALSDQGKYAEAEKMHQETLALREKVSGKKHPDTLLSVYCLAYTLHQQGQHKEALSLYHRACIGYEEKLGPSHPTTRACLSHYSSLRQLCSLKSADSSRSHLNNAQGDFTHAPPQQQSQTVI